MSWSTGFDDLIPMSGGSELVTPSEQYCPLPQRHIETIPRGTRVFFRSVVVWGGCVHRVPAITLRVPNGRISRSRHHRPRRDVGWARRFLTSWFCDRNRRSLVAH